MQRKIITYFFISKFHYIVPPSIFMLHLYYLKSHIRSLHPYTFNIFHKDIWLFFILLIYIFWINYFCYMLHIASCHFFILFYWNALISFYQDYFNMSCHRHMNMCYLIGRHVHMLILFKRSLTKEQLDAKCEYGKMLWHSSREKTTIEWLSFHTIHGIQFPFLLFQLLFLVL